MPHHCPQTSWAAPRSAALLLITLTTAAALGCGDSDAPPSEARPDATNSGSNAATNAGTGGGTSGGTSGRTSGAQCSNGTPALEDGTCLGEWACPAGWSRPEDGLGCAPAALSQTCPEGTFAVPGEAGCSEPWPCPDGWSRVDDGGIGCKPPALRDDCPDGAFPIPGPEGCSLPWACPDGWHRMDHGPGCAPTPPDACDDGALPSLDGACAPLLHDACPDDPFGDHPWPDTTVFVSTRARAGGDGTRDAPLSNLLSAVALAAQRDPAVIALAPGTYTLIGLPQLRAIDRIGGACAASVTLNTAFSVTHDLHLHDLTLRPSSADTFTVTQSAHLTLDRARVIAQRDGPAVVVSGRARLTADRVWIDGDGRASGIAAEDEARVTCARCLVERTASTAARASDDAELTLTHSALRGNRAPADGDAAYALYADQRGRVTAQDTLLIDNTRGGSARLDGAASLALTRVAVRDSSAPPDADVLRAALELHDDSSATLEDVVIDGANGVGVFTDGRASLTATRLAVARVAPTGADGGLGYGVLALGQSDAWLHHASVYDAAGGALVASDDSALEARDAWISRVAVDGSGWSYGARGEDAAQVALRDSALVDLDGIAVSAAAPDGAVTLERVRLDRVHDHPTARGLNAALSATAGSSVALRDVHIARFSQRALVVRDADTHIDAARVSVAEAVLGEDALNINDARLAPISAFAGARLDLRDLWIVDAPESWVAAIDGSHARVERLTGRRNLATNAAAMRRPSASSALVALGGSTLEGQHLDLSDLDGRGVDILGSVGALSDARVDSVRNTASYGGHGVYVADGGDLTLTRAHLSALAGDGVFAHGASVIRASGLHVRDLPYTPAASSGVGAALYDGGALEVHDARFERCGLAALLAHEDTTASAQRTRSDAVDTFDMIAFGGTLNVSDHYGTGGRGFGLVAVRADLALARVVLRDRAALDSGAERMTAGLGSFDSATVQAAELVVAANATDGVQAMTGDVDLARALVQGNARGLVRLLAGDITQTQTLVTGNAIDTLTCDSVCVDGPGVIPAAEPPAAPVF